MPLVLQDCCSTWVVLNPDHSIRRWTRREVETHFRGDALFTQVWALTKSISERADVARLFLLRDFGGWWVDTDFECLQPIAAWELPAITSSGFVGAAEDGSANTSTGLLYSRPGGELVRALCFSLLSTLQIPGSTMERSGPRSYRPAVSAFGGIPLLLAAKVYPTAMSHYDNVEELDDRLLAGAWACHHWWGTWIGGHTSNRPGILQRSLQRRSRSSQPQHEDHAMEPTKLIRVRLDGSTSLDLAAAYRHCSPAGDGRWKGMQVVASYDPEFDYSIIIDQPLSRYWVKPPSQSLAFEVECPSTRNRLNIAHLANPPRVQHRQAASGNLPNPMLMIPYNEIRKPVEGKNRVCSTITSDLNFLPGHALRHQLTPGLLKLPWFRGFGRGFPAGKFTRKDEPLLPFKYHIAIENQSAPGYYTEKIVDSILAECLTFYWGCPDLEKYLPADAFIRIPAEDPAAAIAIIEDAVSGGEWRRRLPAIREAKRILLEERNPLNQIWTHLLPVAIADGLITGADLPPADEPLKQSAGTHLFAIYTCRKYEATRAAVQAATWPQRMPAGAELLTITGDGLGTIDAAGVLRLGCPDHYAGLIDKTQALFDWFLKERTEEWLVKVDDDVWLSPEAIKAVIDCKQSYAGYHTLVHQSTQYLSGPIYSIHRSLIAKLGRLRDFGTLPGCPEDVAVGAACAAVGAYPSTYGLARVAFVASEDDMQWTRPSIAICLAAHAKLHRAMFAAAEATLVGDDYTACIGGLGNQINAALCAYASNLRVDWTHDIPLETIFPGAQFPRRIPGVGVSRGTPYWFPGTCPTRLGSADHHPTHERISQVELTHAHWRYDDSPRPVRPLPQAAPAGDKIYDIGVHLRLLHPHIERTRDQSYVAQIVAALNLAAKTQRVLLISDAAVPGVDTSLVTHLSANMEHDLDRGADITLQQWGELRRCRRIYRASTISTFTNYHCFVDRIPHDSTDALVLQYLPNATLRL